MREICHALGFWHEQSRPDRDSYITVHNDVILTENFMIRKEKEVDYQGTGYDYGSIVHYGRSLTVNNNAEYARQGHPDLGQRDGLSPTDIIQLNRLYKCPGPGQRGVLVLYIRHGVNLENTDVFSDPDPYVKVRAIDSNGHEVVRTTARKQGTEDPTWNENLAFGDRDWQFFRISVWNSDVISDDPIGMSVTVPLLNQPSAASWQKYCTNTLCNRYIMYDYDLLPPVTTGRLRVKVRYARNLPDTDPRLNDPDPYVRVGVLGLSGSTRFQNSNAETGTINPTWNTWLSLSLSERSFASRITIQVFDDDVALDDAMSDPQLFDITSGYHSGIRHCVTTSCQAYLIFDYEVLLNKYERRLSIYARYGSNLPDEDGWPAGKSDPYLKVVAYDINRNTRTKTTSTDQGDEDPEWNETLDFGVGMWTRFEVSVWDSDLGSDDRLSSTHTRSLPSSGTVSRTGVSFSCYSGYVVINYSFV